MIHNPYESKTPAEPAMKDLTARDLFAMNALNGLLTNPDLVDMRAEQFARIAYHYADAMLVQREVKP